MIICAQGVKAMVLSEGFFVVLGTLAKCTICMSFQHFTMAILYPIQTFSPVETFKNTIALQSHGVSRAANE